MTDAAVEPGAIEVWNEGKHGTQETVVAAVEAHAKAAVQARWIMAMQRPRDLDTVRERLLRECKRPAFAAVARWNKPRGGQSISGLSIRFAETALRCMTNIYTETPVLSDDESKRIVAIQVTDLETNVTFGQNIVLAKEIERRSIPKGAESLRTRIGASGQRLYVLRATDDDILDRQNALMSKALRTHGLRHVPGWLLDEAETVLLETARQNAAEDPDAARRKLLDSFAKIGVTAERLKAYAGHDLGHLSPDQITDLRGLYQALSDGAMTFDEAFEQKHGEKTGSKGGSVADDAAKAAIDAATKKSAKKGG